MKKFLYVLLVLILLLVICNSYKTNEELTQEVQEMIFNLQEQDSKSVKFTPMDLTDAQKSQARENIGAAALTDVSSPYNFKGTVAAVSNLPSAKNEVNDTYYATLADAMAAAKQLAANWIHFS